MLRRCRRRHDSRATCFLAVIPAQAGIHLSGRHDRRRMKVGRMHTITNWTQIPQKNADRTHERYRANAFRSALSVRSALISVRSGGDLLHKNWTPISQKNTDKAN